MRSHIYIWCWTPKSCSHECLYHSLWAGEKQEAVWVWVGKRGRRVNYLRNGGWKQQVESKAERPRTLQMEEERRKPRWGTRRGEEGGMGGGRRGSWEGGAGGGLEREVEQSHWFFSSASVGSVGPNQGAGGSWDLSCGPTVDPPLPREVHSWAYTQLWWMKDSSEGGERIAVSQELTEKYWEMGELRKTRTGSQNQGLRWGQGWDDCDQRGKEEKN